MIQESSMSNKRTIAGFCKSLTGSINSFGVRRELECTALEGRSFLFMDISNAAWMAD